MDYLTYRWTSIVLLFHTTYISVDLARHEIFPVKVGKDGISDDIGPLLLPWRFDWQS